MGSPALQRLLARQAAKGGASEQPTCASPVSEEALQEAFEERAGIIEFDAGLPREQAELAARACAPRG